MTASLIIYPGSEVIGHRLVRHSGFREIPVTIRSFPDGESYVRIKGTIESDILIVICQLDRPDSKMLSLIYLARKAKDMGAKQVILVAPYLPYMRQDVEFQKGESVSSAYFASLVSQYFDGLITIDPHLHRIQHLAQIYAIPVRTLSSVALLADYIHRTVKDPLIIGPDSESKQWVRHIASLVGADYQVCQKQRHSDREISLSVPDLSHSTGQTPVLVDDIIATGGTLTQAVRYLRTTMKKRPLVIGIHGIFAEDAYSKLQSAGVSEIITTNTVTHVTNKIDITPLVYSGMIGLLQATDAAPV